MSWDPIDSAATIQMTPPAGPFPWGRAANRRMCTGVYVDREFRDRLLRTVYSARKRRVAPSYGFDLVLVLAHAWRAWRLELAQDIIVLAILVGALTQEPLQTLIAAAALSVWYLTHALIHLVGEFTAYYWGDRTFADFEKMRSRGNVLTRALLTACIVLGASVYARWRTHAHTGESWLFRSGLAGAGVIFLSLLATIAIMSAIRQMKISLLRRRDADVLRPAGRRLLTIYSQQRHPFVVYSGFRPFIGSGLQVRTWSFAQRLIHEKSIGSESDREFATLPFSAADLVCRLKKMITELAQDNHRETRLPGLTVTDQVFVEGTHAQQYMTILQPNRTQKDIEDAIADAIASSGEVARHYLACQVASWGGEVVTSVFVHVSLQGRTLYLEFSTYALLPTRPEYHVIDEVGGTGLGAVMRAAVKSLATASDAFLAARRLLVGIVQLWDGLMAQSDGTAVLRRGIDIGAAVSARETAATGSDENYFQLRDIFQHSKIIERRLIASVGDFLKERHVDTSEFWQRATTILNNGVMNTNVGTVNISGSAFGEQASVENVAPADQATSATSVESGGR